MKKSARFHLPLPVSVNRLYTITTTRGMKPGQKAKLILTDEGRQYKKTVIGKVENYYPPIPRFGKSRLRFWIEAHFPDRRTRDLSNLLKILEDSLQSAEVFENDSQIDDGRQVRKFKRNPPFVLVEIQEL